MIRVNRGGTRFETRQSMSQPRIKEKFRERTIQMRPGRADLVVIRGIMTGEGQRRKQFTDMYHSVLEETKSTSSPRVLNWRMVSASAST